MSSNFYSYARAIEQLTTTGEEVTIVGPAGLAYKGKINDVGPNLLRLISHSGTQETLINPAHIVSVSVVLAEA